ncbi:MAG TPA: hypothetical protein VIH22_02965, partial [Cyclobacteriaceae bacterium]
TVRQADPVPAGIKASNNASQGRYALCLLFTSFQPLPYPLLPNQLVKVHLGYFEAIKVRIGFNCP